METYMCKLCAHACAHNVHRLGFHGTIFRARILIFCPLESILCHCYGKYLHMNLPIYLLASDYQKQDIEHET